MREIEMTAAGKINASNLDTTHRILIDTRGGAYEGDTIRPSQTKTGEHVQAVAVSMKYKASGRRGYVIVTSAGTFYAEPIQTMILAPEDAAGIKRAHAEALELDKVYEAYPVAEEAPAAPAAEEERAVESLESLAAAAAPAAKALEPIGKAATKMAGDLRRRLEIPMMDLGSRMEGAGGSMPFLPAPAERQDATAEEPVFVVQEEASRYVGRVPAPAVQLTDKEIKEARRSAREAARSAEVDALREEFTGSARWDAGRRLAIRLRLAQLSATVYPDRFESPEEYEVDRLRARFHSTNVEAERERIRGKLAALGTVVHPEGLPEYERYRADLKKALEDPKAWDFLDV